MIYGYARVSTRKQINCCSLEEQKAILEAKGCHEIIVEQFTGKTTSRPKLDQLINKLNAGDTLIVSKLDRLARTVNEGSMLIQRLISGGITVDIANMGVVSDKPINKLTLDILLAFAEFERNMIIERTLAGKEVAKTKEGFRDGRPPKYTKYQVDNALGLLKSYSYTEVEKMTGISKSTLIRAKRLRAETVEV